MRFNLAFVALTVAFGSSTALAQLEPFTDYDISDTVLDVTMVKVDPNMIDDYLEGLRETWVASNAVAKELGHIVDYRIYGSVLPQSGDFNLVLVIEFASGADAMFTKERYQAFMKEWGEQRQEKTREIAKDYPSMREITGEYWLQQLTMK